ncbi:unnamed protein product, partial [Staurois parvus]
LPDPAFTISALPGPCIHYIALPGTSAFTISALPGPCIYYIWSDKTLHSLYLVSLDPAFTISALPGPCIHYIRSPWTLHSLYPLSPDPHSLYPVSRTLHSLYPLSPDPAFTISALPQYTEHGNAIILVNINC